MSKVWFGFNTVTDSTATFYTDNRVFAARCIEVLKINYLVTTSAYYSEDAGNPDTIGSVTARWPYTPGKKTVKLHKFVMMLNHDKRVASCPSGCVQFI